jgi:hypothetical protein
MPASIVKNATTEEEDKVIEVACSHKVTMMHSNNNFYHYRGWSGTASRICPDMNPKVELAKQRYLAWGEKS